MLVGLVEQVVGGGGALVLIEGESRARSRRPATACTRGAAGAKRKLVPRPDGMRILAIGCTSGGPYERPDGFRLGPRS